MKKEERTPVAGAFVKMHEELIDPSTIVFSGNVRGWCKLPYENHPKGCPNVLKCTGRKVPAAENERRIKTSYESFLLVYAEFDLKEYKRSMKLLHPSWSPDQIKCVRYWQNSVKATVLHHLENLHRGRDFLGSGSGSDGNPSMEAAGIDVFATLAGNGINFEKKPENKALIVFLSMKKKSRGSMF
jgi:hypothetical protein